MVNSLSRRLKHRCVSNLCLVTWCVVAPLNVNASDVRSRYRQIQKQRRDDKLSSDPRIVGGTPAAPGAYPFHVSSMEGTTYFCGGTLIAPDIVLTAAHCKKERAFVAGVNIGGVLLDGSDAVETLAVEGEFAHPDYMEFGFLNDIMLVKLAEPSTLSPVVELNFDASIPAVNDVVTAIGFGDTFDGGDLSPELLTVTLDTFDDSSCFDWYDYVSDTTICAGTVAGGRDSCQGDSGGPLLTADNVQVGIVSYGDICGLANVPAIYTELATFELFILQGICDLSDTPPAYCDLSTVPDAVDQPTTAHTAADVEPTRAPTIVDEPTAEPTINADTDEPTIEGGPTIEPTINADTDEPTIEGGPTIEPTFDETKPPNVGKGKGKGKDGVYGKGKGGGGMHGKGVMMGKGGGVLRGKGNIMSHRGKGRVVHYGKGFKTYNNALFRNVDDHVGSNYDSGEDDDENFFHAL